MSKVIEITSCIFCPNYREIKTTPFCAHPQRSHREIHYITNRLSDGKPVLANDFPVWCPLEDSADFAETHFDIDNPPS